ncbi:hypothetical protein Tco_0961513 [Tanacetum coccineum]
MTEPSGGGLDDLYERERTPPPLTKEQIEGHISTIKSIIKYYNRQNKADSIRLDFGTDNIPLKEGRVARGKDVDEEDLMQLNQVCVVPDAYTFLMLPRVPLSFQARACSLSTLHFLKVSKNNLKSLKVPENNLESLKLQEKRPIDGLDPLTIKKITK